MIYQVGKYYEVPCAVGNFMGTIGCIYLDHTPGGLEIVPVFLPMHEDKEIINFPQRHYHFNWQFVPERFFKHCKISMYSSESLVYAYVLSNFNDVEPRIEYRRLRCKRELPAFPHVHGAGKWPQHLKEAYKGQTLRNGHICPHRGADLSHVRPDDNGCRTCPCHGLVFGADGVCLGNEYESLTSPSDGAQTKQYEKTN
jgi:hypothetical protein